MVSLKVMVFSLAIMITNGCGQQGGGLPPINGVQGPIFNVIDVKGWVRINKTSYTNS